MDINNDDILIDTKQIRHDISRGLIECGERGLSKTTKFLAELNYSIKHVVYEAYNPPNPNESEISEHDSYILAKSLFDCQEFDRAAYFLENCSTSKCRFLHLYSKYMSCEKKRLDNLDDVMNYATETTKCKVLRDLFASFKADRNKLDGYLLYLYGVILRKLGLTKMAVEVLEESVNAIPWAWAPWLELSAVVGDMETLQTLNLPRHWMLYFFLGHTYVELKLTDQALETYGILKNMGFEKCTYVDTQIAIAHHDRRDVESAMVLFKGVVAADPSRLDGWDVYSHLLYVKERRTELASLAHRAVAIDKYRVETCCVVANYYSLRGEHQKAVVQFGRALALQPRCLPAWILMGHEYIELQNSNAAIQCYRQAIEVNRNDYRAWNGLGQAYEIIGLTSYSLYYYARAAHLRPNDSRMLVALGEAFEKLDKVPSAVKCYYRAHGAGDVEGMALFKLAKLYEKLSLSNNAAAAYTAACSESGADVRELAGAHRFLANYHLRLALLDHAAHHAYRCLDYQQTKEEGKVLLKSIAEKRAAAGSTSAEEGAGPDAPPPAAAPSRPS